MRIEWTIVIVVVVCAYFLKHSYFHIFVWHCFLLFFSFDFVFSYSLFASLRTQDRWHTHRNEMWKKKNNQKNKKIAIDFYLISLFNVFITLVIVSVCLFICISFVVVVVVLFFVPLLYICILLYVWARVALLWAINNPNKKKKEK